MHLCAALPGRLLDLFIKREVGECTDGQHHEVHAPAQHRNGHGPHRFHRSGFHDVFRLQRQQSIHVRAGRTPHACRRLLCRGEGAAGDAHQLVVFQQALLPRIGHDIAEEAAAHDAKFRFHVSVSPFSRRVGGFFLFQYTMSSPEKQKPAFFMVFLSFTQETGRFAQVLLIFFRRCGIFKAT